MEVILALFNMGLNVLAFSWTVVYTFLAVLAIAMIGFIVGMGVTHVLTSRKEL